MQSVYLNNYYHKIYTEQIEESSLFQAIFFFCCGINCGCNLHCCSICNISSSCERLFAEPQGVVSKVLFQAATLTL